MLEVLDDAKHNSSSENVIYALSEPLWTLLGQIEAEMNSCALPMVPDTTLDELKPYSRATAKHLKMLAPVLDIKPTEALVTQYSMQQAVDRVGSHRVGVALLMAQLLRAQCLSVAKAIKETSLLLPLAQLALKAPTCSALHAAVISTLRVAVSESCGREGLWQDVVDSSDAIPSALDILKTNVQGVETRGQRSPGAAFAISFLELLASAALEQAESPPTSEERSVGVEDVEWRQNLASALRSFPEWEELTSLSQTSQASEKQSSLAAELKVQHAELAGPRPVRQTPPLDNLDPEFGLFRGGGQMISGQDLLALLRGLSVKGGHGGSEL